MSIAGVVAFGVPDCCVAAVVSAGYTPEDIAAEHQLVREGFTEAQARMIETAAQGLQSTPRFPNVDNLETQVIGATCLNAIRTLGAMFNNCSAFGNAAQLFNGGVPTQTQIDSYCGAQCKADFQTYLLGGFVQSCSGAEILEFELLDAINHPGNGFRLFKLIQILRMPCVKDPSGNYCLQTFMTLVTSFPAGTQPTDATLAPVCKPCLFLFLVEYVKYATPQDLKGYAFIDVLCTRAFKDGQEIFCVPEWQAIDALPDSDPTKLPRICNTRCFQKIIVKLYLANPGNQAARANLTNVFIFLDVYCAHNQQNGALCGKLLPALFAPGGPLQDGITACAADFGKTSCSPSCTTAAKKLYDSMGCCFTTYLGAETYFHPAPTPIPQNDNTFIFQQIAAFISGQCQIPKPAACPSIGKAIATTIVVRNLLFAYYVANVKLVEEAILLDICVHLGARPSQCLLALGSGQGSQVQGKPGFGLQAATPEGVSFQINMAQDGGASNDIGHVGPQFMLDVQTGNVQLTQTGQLPVSSRSDVTAGPSVDPTSSVTYTAGAASLSASMFVIVAAIAASLLL